MSEQNITVGLRRLVANRAANCCEYCRTQACFSSDPFTMDHITPRSIGGPSRYENLALACHGCNQHKSKRTSALDPLTGLLVPLFHPREHGWDEHFAWNEDFTVVVGLTPTGRTTILALRLNRPGLVNLRRALYAIGEHPPKII
jgi:hypothetical protein